jgi:pimeloyl-ACP methyl ester carboxylesterase
LESWVKLAEKEPRFQGRATFSYAVYPSQSSDSASARRDGAALISQWVDRIDQAPAGSQFILAGHSSGAAVADAVALKVKEKSRIKLIVLDGFLPDPTLLAQAVCWSATDDGAGTLHSLNFATTKTCPNFHVLRYGGCTNSMCLHFSLINAGARSAGITSSNFAATGYKDLSPTLAWVDEVLGTVAR